DQQTVGLSATPPADLPAGDYFWRVAGMDASSASGPFSAAWTFDKSASAPPTLVNPADGTTLTYPQQPPVFSWDPIPGAKSYTLQIDDAPDFLGGTSYTTANTWFTLTNPQTIGQQFYWRVFATSSGGVVTDFSEARSYQIAWPYRPVLQSPGNALSPKITDVNLSWGPVPGAAKYELQVSPNQDFANNVTIDVTIDSTKYSPPTTIDNGAYYWRVRALDAANTPDFGQWSDVWQFTRGWVQPSGSEQLERPTLLTPAWDPTQLSAIPHVSSGPTLSWGPIHHAAYYQVDVSSDINFSPTPGVTFSCLTNHTSFTPYTPDPLTRGLPGACAISQLNPGVIYYWRVRGVDAPGNVPDSSKVFGVWSNTGNADTFRFMLDPTMPAYLSPDDGASVGSPALSWQSVVGASYYRVTIKKANGTAVPGSPVKTYATSYTPTTALTPSDGPFSWYAQAVDENGDASLIPAQSAWRTFTLTTPASSSSFALTSPANGSSGIRMPAMLWQPQAGAAKYEVHYAANGVELPALPNSQTLPYASYTDTNVPLSPDTYSWWIVARDAAGMQVAVSDVQTFTITAPSVLGNGDYLTPARCDQPDLCASVADTPTLSWN
ncbi:MAG: hypothetical protein J2P17_29800, partial [Mycobacterium sp.]|nr:hypothetical protein [Mycobacterium sp.]